MANMSASILRNLVSSIFNIDARKIELSGEISPMWRGSFTDGVSYMDYSCSGDREIWGFSPKEGFKQIEGCISVKTMYNGNHKCHYADADALMTCVTGKELFFLVIKGDDSDEPFSWRYILHKAPNFQEYWKEIKQKDINRWEQWLNQ